MNPKLTLMPLISSFEAIAEIACLSWESQLPDPPEISTLNIARKLSQENLEKLQDFMVRSEIGGVKDKTLFLEVKKLGKVQIEDVRFEVIRRPHNHRSIFDEFLESLP